MKDLTLLLFALMTLGFALPAMQNSALADDHGEEAATEEHADDAEAAPAEDCADDAEHAEGEEHDCAEEATEEAADDAADAAEEHHEEEGHGDEH